MKCSGIAGLAGISTSVCDALDRSPPVVISSTLGRRFLPVSSGADCSALERGVVESGRPAEALALAREVADFHDLRMDFRTLLRSAGAEFGGCWCW